MKTLCIYHSNCADGFGAAWVVRQALGAENVEFHPGHYGKPAPDVEGRDVIIVDFSYPYELLVLLGHQARSILIIDHHKTAAADLARLQPAPATYREWVDSEQRVGTVFDMHRSGAGLTWDYITNNQPRPALINHIEDRDLWRFALEGTREIIANLFSYAHDFDTWDALMEQHPAQHMAAGKAIERKQQKDIADLVASNSRYLVIGGVTVPAINLPHTMASDAGHLLCKGQPFAAIYWDTAEGRSFSLRSTDEGDDVSAIAKQYGGGGHRNAAGFKVPFDHELVTGHVQATLEATTDSPDLRAALADVTECLQLALTGGQVPAARAGRALVNASELLGICQPNQLATHPEPLPVARDECGHWTHPAWPKDGEENAIPKTWFVEHGLEVFIVEFEYDASEELTTAHFEDGNPDCSAWQPSCPVGEGWFVFSIHDTEDGPVCVWVRPAQTTEEGGRP